MLDRPYWKLTLLGLGVVSACSLTVPSKDEVFGSAGGSSATAGTSNASGDAGTSSSAGTMPTGNTGGVSTEGGQPSSPSAGEAPMGGGMGSVGDGGAGGDTGAPLPPMGEIVNPSFEGASLMGWTVSPPSSAVFSQFAAAVNGLEAVDGSYVLSTWASTAYTVKISQVIEGLEDGTYRLAVYSANKISMPRANLYAKNCGGTDPEPVRLSGSGQALVEVAIEAVEVVGGKCEIGLDIDAVANDWVNADVFTFEKVPAQ